MTREEIKKGLECCKTDWCVRCPYFEYVGCEVGLKQDAHNLITKQEQEIAELKAAKNDWKQRYESLDQRYMALVASSVECVDKKVKKAKIDVLNKAKEQCKAIAKEWSDDGDVDGIFAACSCSQAIDDLIEEVGGTNNDH